jgi:hypothetical protein
LQQPNAELTVELWSPVGEIVLPHREERRAESSQWPGRRDPEFTERRERRRLVLVPSLAGWESLEPNKAQGWVRFLAFAVVLALSMLIWSALFHFLFSWF